MKKSSLIKKLLIIHVVIILTVLLFLGGKYFLTVSHPGYYAGKIFDKKISSEAFKDAYARTLIQTRFQYGKMFENIEPLLDLEEQTWESLILIKEAQNRKIKVTKKEIINEIAKFKIFYRNNKFNTFLYKNILRKAFDTQPSIFEESIRDMLIKQKLQEEITASTTLTDKDVLEEYKNHNEKMQLSYVLIPLKDYKEKVSVTDAEIESYYLKNKNNFLLPKSIKVAHIHLNFPKDGGVQKQVEMKYKAKAIIDDYQKTKNLKLSAEKLGFDLTETDYFSKTDLNVDIGLAFAELSNLFKSGTGKVLEPFKTEKGYVIVKILDKKNPHIGDLSEVKDKIKETLITNKSRDMAIAEAKKIRKQIMDKWSSSNQEEKDFSKILTALDIKNTPSPLLTKDQITYNFGLVNDFEKNTQQLFSLTQKNPISDVIPVTNGASIFHLDLFESYDPQKFEKEKETFRENLLNQKKEEVFSSFVEDLLKKADLLYY